MSTYKAMGSPVKVRERRSFVEKRFYLEVPGESPAVETGPLNELDARIIEGAHHMFEVLQELSKAIRVTELDGTSMLPEMVRENRRRIELARAAIENVKRGLIDCSPSIKREDAQ